MAIEVSETEALDAYSRAVTSVAERLAPSVANLRVARNDLLPLVALNYTYGVPGLGPTPGDAFSQSWDKTSDSHQLGLSLQVPIGNEAARARVRRALLNRLQALATRDQRVLQIQQEVFDATDAIDADWQRILASRKRVVLAGRAA